MTHEERHLRPRSGVWIASTCVAAYFGLSLVPHALPGLGGTGLSFAYVLSLPIVVLLLLAVGVWGGVGLLRAWVRGRPPRPRHRAYLLVGCVALASFTLALGLARAVPRPLPTGSDLERFDRAVWQDPRSADYVPGDVTPTTKDAGGRCEERPAGPALGSSSNRSSGRHSRRHTSRAAAVT